jgi:hypothetical protein
LQYCEENVCKNIQCLKHADCLPGGNAKIHLRELYTEKKIDSVVSNIAAIKVIISGVTSLYRR